MATKTFKKKSESIETGSLFLSDPDHPKMLTIEVNTNEKEGELDIALHFTKVRAKDFIGISIYALLNDNRAVQYQLARLPENPPGDIMLYQVSIPFDNMQLKDNLITFFLSGSLITSTVAGDFKLATLTGFVEDTKEFTEVRLNRTSSVSTKDEAFWQLIKQNGINFKKYQSFINTVLAATPGAGNPANLPGSAVRNNFVNRSPFVLSEEYNIIKFATEYYMLKTLGVDTRSLGSYLSGGNNLIPYFEDVAARLSDDLLYDDKNIPQDDADFIREDQRLHRPFMIELIWSYWMEQGMLVQTMNAIMLRFQNLHAGDSTRVLSRFDIDPLRAIGHFLWAYIQDEQHRLSIPRRHFEYIHEYGLFLLGKAVPQVNHVESRTMFLEAFHNLLTTCSIFFKEADDTTRIPDAFTVWNTLREVHLLLAEGNHNAYGNLTWTARHEMLLQQYILARPEMREFLGGKPMIPYEEPWMDRVDTMRNIMGWGSAGIQHYYDLAKNGEWILLGIRYGNWNSETVAAAGNWARDFRQEIQRYIHAYKSVTGVDLSADAIELTNSRLRNEQPAVLIQNRLLTDNGRKKIA